MPPAVCEGRLPDQPGQTLGKFPTSAPAAAPTGPTEVAINGFAFGPGTIKVSAGQKLTWTNRDDKPHQISVVGSGQRSEVMLKGQAATLQFDAAGHIVCVCGLHPTMKGSIEVAAQ